MLASLALAASLACGSPGQRDRPSSPASPLGFLTAGEEKGFARAEAPRTFAFPADHGPHEAFRSEWWYFTGVLHGSSGRDYGYQVTFFRQALAPEVPARPSAWRTRDVYMAHLAVSALDAAPATSSFVAEERFARAGNGIAGAAAAPFAVWTDSWRVEQENGEPPTRWHVRARGREMAVDLVLDLAEARGPLLQGPGGLSRKGPNPGQASYYHSWTRIPTTGTVTLASANDARAPRPASETAAVQGLTWLDREWSTAPLATGVRGWDWMGLSLGDGRDVMLFVLRDDAGAPIAASCASVIGPDRQAHLYGPDAFHAKPEGRWTSPLTQVAYPARFVVELPAEKLALVVTPRRPDQELRLAVRYWEGAVAVTGTSAGQPVTGEGYLELTGYEPR